MYSLMFTYAYPHMTTTETKMESTPSTPRGSLVALPVGPPAPLPCKVNRTLMLHWLCEGKWQPTQAGRKEMVQDRILGRVGRQHKGTALGKDKDLSLDATCPCNAPSYCPGGQDNQQHLPSMCAEITAGAQDLHVKQSCSLPLPGIPASNQKQNADK